MFWPGFLDNGSGREFGREIHCQYAKAMITTAITACTWLGTIAVPTDTPRITR
jgi:hypothetical protein